MTIIEGEIIGYHDVAVGGKLGTRDILDSHKTTKTDQTIQEQSERTRDLSEDPLHYMRANLARSARREDPAPEGSQLTY